MTDLKDYFIEILLVIVILAAFVCPIMLILWIHAKVVKKRLRKENPSLSEFGINELYEPFTFCTFLLITLSIFFISIPVLLIIKNTYLVCV